MKKTANIQQKELMISFYEQVIYKSVHNRKMGKGKELTPKYEV